MYEPKPVVSWGKLLKNNFYYRPKFFCCYCCWPWYHEIICKSLKGAGGGGLHQDFLEIDFLVVSDRNE